MKTFKIRNLEISPGLVLSPMSGVTTSAFRRLIKRNNPGCVGLTVSEFVSAEAMTRAVPRTFDMMKFRAEERPYGIQIFGADPVRMADAAQIVEGLGADLVDINCGCPAPKVVKKGGGCELMRNPLLLEKILSSVRKAVKIPLTLKMRSGWDENSKNFLEIAKLAEDCGVEAITIHGRTRAQLYRGEADWSLFEKVLATVSIPVCGSGDVVCRESADVRFKVGVSGLFIGRGALSNPFIFSEIMGTPVYKAPEEVMLEYIALLREDFHDRACIGKVKQLASQFAKGTQWRRQVLQEMELSRIEELLQTRKSHVTN
jgi:nifR3 family TIM-barrel protein